MGFLGHSFSNVSYKEVESGHLGQNTVSFLL